MNTTYKNTEIGSIPVDWEVKELGSILSLGSGKDYKHLDKGDIPVYGTGGVMTYVNNYLHEGESVGIGRKGTIDKPVFLSGKFWTVDTLFYANQFVNLNPKFIYYKFCLVKWREYNEASGVPSLNKNTLYRIKFSLPKLTEQTAIANALSDADALINNIEKLITKKRNIKQGAMQKLLQPKEGWEVKKLGDCLLKSPDYGINAAAVAYDDTLPTYLRITDISEEGKYLQGNKVSVNNGLSHLYYLDEGDLVVTRTGASVGKTYHYHTNDGKLVFAGFLIRIKARPEMLNSKYLFFLTQTQFYWAWVLANSMRSGQPGLNSQELKSFEIPLPPLETQIGIAQILSDMDLEIAGLEGKLSKYRAIKTGMMQNLLTGKIRLV